MASSIAPLTIHTEKLPYRDISFSMVEVQGGSFLLNDQILTEVSPFQIGQYLVSQELWEEIMGRNPSEWKGASRPVESISWYDCIEFCNQFSNRMNLEPYYELDKGRKDVNSLSEYDELKYYVRPRPAANGFRLPTEAEWEYAARGGPVQAAFRFSGSNDINRIGWYKDTGFSQTHPLGSKLPNGLGIYDMTGNLREWCWDWYGDFPLGPLKDPLGPKRGLGRVLRGASWSLTAQYCRVGIRSDSLPDTRHRACGLRLSRTAI